MVRIEEERIEQYRQYVIALVNQYASYKPRYGEVELEAITDREHNHYEVITVGWEGDEQVHGCILHIDLKDGKLWVQHDGTDAGIADLLVEMGVPKEDIVLGFQPLHKRPYTGFSVKESKSKLKCTPTPPPLRRPASHSSPCAEHPNPASIRQMLAALGLEVAVTESSAPALFALIDMPKGREELA